ncbi:MAG: FAD-dependent oxidoreductase [Limnochordia bacterium]
MKMVNPSRIAVLLVVCLLLFGSLPGYAAAPLYKPGRYEGEAAGHNGPIKVAVTFGEGMITAIDILAHQETRGVGDLALAPLAEEIIEHQSLGVDVVTGATITSYGLMAAVANCVQQAGGDVAALRAKTVPKVPGEKIVKTADVVVVGGGGAGIAATISAVENGASVILIEKTANLGGNTVISGCAWNGANPELFSKTPAAAGLNEKLKSFYEMDESELPAAYRSTLRTLKEQISTYLAGDTSMMFDSPELHIIQTYFAGKRQGLDGSTIEPRFEFIEILCRQSLAAQEWLKRTVGTVFNDVLAEPIGSLWRRSNGVGDRYEEFFGKPARYITANGGEILLDVTGKELLVENGRVVGVYAEMKDGTPMELRAKKGVILATGGFGANTDMVIEYNAYWPEIDPKILTTNRKEAAGDGIIMGLAVGAGLSGMGYTQLMPIGWAHTGHLAFGEGSNVMYINKEGKRFVNEYAERDVLSKAAFAEGGLFYELKTLGTDMWPSARGEDTQVMFFADTLEEMAAKIGCDAATLKGEVERYNTFVEKGHDPDFGKTSFTYKIEAPYVARAMRPSIHHTMGGLAIDTDCRVLDTQGKVIPGLYAAGEVTGGIHAGNRVGGNAIADIFVFGRIAGANAAQGK